MDVITTWGCLPQPQLATNWTTNKKRSEAKISASGWIRRWGGGDMQEVVRIFNLSQEGCITWRRVFGLNCRWEEWLQCPTHVSVYNQGRQASNFWEKHHIEVDTCTDINMSDIVLHCADCRRQNNSRKAVMTFELCPECLSLSGRGDKTMLLHTQEERGYREMSALSHSSLS